MYQSYSGSSQVEEKITVNIVDIWCNNDTDMQQLSNKSSAVAEMGDRLATIGMG